MATLLPDLYYVKHPAVVAVGSARRYVLLRPQRPPLVFDDELAGMVSDLIGLLAEPVQGSVLSQRALAIGTRSEPLLDRLLNEQVVVIAPGSQIADMFRDRRPVEHHPLVEKMVVGITGAVQAAAILPYLDALYFECCRRMEIIMTESALRFLNPRTLKYIYNVDAWIDTFDPRDDVNVPHMHLAMAADVIIVLPATAHTIHRLATGACSDLLSLVVTASRAPTVIVPAMNRSLWLHPAVQRNVNQLRRDGMYIVEPGLGREVSQGRDATPELCGLGVTPEALIALTRAVVTAGDRSASLPPE